MKLTNQPAFPTNSTTGMTLRQYYAGLAMQSVIVSDKVTDAKWQNDKGEIRLLPTGHNPAEDGTNWKHVATPTQRKAIQAVAFADALIAELEKP